MERRALTMAEAPPSELGKTAAAPAGPEETTDKSALEPRRERRMADVATSARLLSADLSHISNVTMPAQGLGAVVVGLGRAGLGLHIPVLEKIRHDSAAASPFGAVVGLVDSVEAGIKRALHRLEYDYGYDPRRISCATSLA